MSFHILQAQKECKKGGRIESYNCLKLELKLFHETYLILIIVYTYLYISLKLVSLNCGFLGFPFCTKNLLKSKILMSRFFSFTVSR